VTTTPSQAVRAYKDVLQRTVSCITGEVLTISQGGYKPHSIPHTIALAGGKPIPLVTNRHNTKVALSIRQNYKLVSDPGRPAYRVHLVGYSYTFTLLDQNKKETGRELFVFHWHPEAYSRSNYSAPHLHIGQRANSPHPEFRRVHVPTGRVDLTSIITFAVTQLNTEPKRTDWQTILNHPHP